MPLWIVYYFFEFLNVNGNFLVDANTWTENWNRIDGGEIRKEKEKGVYGMDRFKLGKVMQGS